MKNFGSLLQSYALKKTLEQLGHRVSFLDIERREEDDRLLIGKQHNFPAEGYTTGLLAKLKKLDKYTVNRFRIKAKDKQQVRLMEEFQFSVLGMNSDTGGEHFDCCIIGSDEVFNCMTGAKWGFTSQLFGDVKQADRVITYAASAGATVLEEIPAGAAERIGRAFERVSGFSVRDRNTYQMVSSLTNKPVLEHLDPVLIGDFEKEMCDAKLPENLPEKYCMIYSYYNRIHNHEEIASIKAFCKAHQLEIVTVGSPQMWIKRHLVLKPFEVLRVFQNADFIITDTFHGTIFSAKYARRFAVMTRQSNQNKLGDLIDRLGVQKHKITSFENLEEAYSWENDRTRVLELCQRERARTIQYLENHL